MSEIEKICVHFKNSGKVGNSEQVLFYCDARDLVLGEEAKVCFVCDLYKASKEDFKEDIRQDIIDYLSGKRKRQGKRWVKRRTGGAKGTTRRRGEDYDEDDDEGESDAEEADAEEGEAEEEEAEEEEEGEEEEGAKKAKPKGEGEEEESEEEEEEGEAEEDEDTPKSKSAKKGTKAKPAAKKAAKPAAKKAAKPASKPALKAASKPAKEIALEDDDREVYEIVKAAGPEGMTQVALKDQLKVQSSKISKIIQKLKDGGYISKEQTKIEDKKGKPIITNLLKSLK